jgi:putative endonuclease
MIDKRAVGRIGEAAARDYLERLGYLILFQNFRYGKYGEIDIIARQSKTICFIEVKSRSGASYGTPAEAVGHAKRRKIVTVANHFLKVSGCRAERTRFDVIEVLYGSASGAEGKRVVRDIRLIENAFGDS